MNNVVLLLILLLILAYVLTSIGFKTNQCGLNEEYTTCGTACPLTCEKPNVGPCTMQCVIGCQCQKGYLRHKSGKCIKPGEC
jgi:hypothetical protein